MRMCECCHIRPVPEFLYPQECHECRRPVSFDPTAIRRTFVGVDFAEDCPPGIRASLTNALREAQGRPQLRLVKR